MPYHKVLLTLPIETVATIATLIGEIRSALRRKEVTLHQLREVQADAGRYNPFSRPSRYITPQVWEIVSPCFTLRQHQTMQELNALQLAAECILRPFDIGDQVYYLDSVYRITGYLPGGYLELDNLFKARGIDLKAAFPPVPALDVSSMPANKVTDGIIAEATGLAHMRVITRGYIIQKIGQMMKSLILANLPLQITNVMECLEDCRIYGVLPDDDFHRLAGILITVNSKRYQIIIDALRAALQSGNAIPMAIRKVAQ